MIAVGNALFAEGGATRKNIAKEWRGEEGPRVSTPDGKPEALNRRVEIMFTR